MVQAYVTGLEAANQVVKYCGQGQTANIIPLEPAEAHVVAARSLIRAGQQLQQLNPFNSLIPGVMT